MAEFDCKLVHRSGSVHGNADALSRCPRGENFPDDCPFGYDNGLISEMENVEKLDRGRCLLLIFENAKAEITTQLQDSNTNVYYVLCRLYFIGGYLIGSDGVRVHHLKRLESPSEEIRHYCLSLEKSFSRILVYIMMIQ